MKIGIETESFHLYFQYGKMDIFDFIRNDLIKCEFNEDNTELSINF